MDMLSIIAASRRRTAAHDADAQAWFDAVVTAGSSITTANKAAVSAFVAGCKTDGIWAAIKASCLLCAADDLTGALVPLKGAAPTNIGGLFVAGDYSRTTGLLGDGTSKHLDANRDASADPQNNYHAAVWVSVALTIDASRCFIGTSLNRNQILGDTSNSLITRCQTSTIGTAIGLQGNTIGLKGMSRSASGSYTVRTGGSNYANSTTSGGSSSSTYVFSRNNSWSNARQSFYSIGEALDLALLDARLATLMAALT